VCRVTYLLPRRSGIRRGRGSLGVEKRTPLRPRAHFSPVPDAVTATGPGSLDYGQFDQAGMVLADDELRADLRDTPHLPLLVGNCDFAEESALTGGTLPPESRVPLALEQVTIQQTDHHQDHGTHTYGDDGPCPIGDPI